MRQWFCATERSDALSLTDDVERATGLEPVDLLVIHGVNAIKVNR
jgi:hypothetical protein